MGPTWVLLAPDGPQIGPMNLDIWVVKNNRTEKIGLVTRTPDPYYEGTTNTRDHILFITMPACRCPGTKLSQVISRHKADYKGIIHIDYFICLSMTEIHLH